MVNDLDYVELGLSCADISRALDRGMNGRRLDEFSQSVCDAINQLTTWVERTIHISSSSTDHTLDRRTVAEIQRKVIKQSGRNAVSRFLHAKNDGGAIAGWKLDLNRILHVFNVCSVCLSLVAADCPFFRPSWL
jgi:hypothetical protein